MTTATRRPYTRRDPTRLQEIMKERGVGKRTAYDYLDRERAEQKVRPERPVEPLTPNLTRERVLLALYRFGTTPDVHTLVANIQADGHKIDGHDAAKMLWSLQKLTMVSFLERNQSPSRITLTDLGKTTAARLSWDDAAAKHATVIVDAVVAPVAPPPVEPVEPLSNLKDVGMERPWPDGMVGWPRFLDIRNRFRVAQKLTAAAKLLEEAGEDDMALTIMGKTEFTPLEEEVIYLLKRFQEVQ